MHGRKQYLRHFFACTALAPLMSLTVVGPSIAAPTSSLIGLPIPLPFVPSAVIVPTPEALRLEQEQRQKDEQALVKITQERARIAEVVRVQRIDCYQRFVVSSCLSRTEQWEREHLAPLEIQELQIQERKRHARAQRRKKTIAHKVEQMQIRKQADRVKLKQLKAKQAARQKQAQARLQQVKHQENNEMRVRLEQQRQQRVVESSTQYQARQQESVHMTLPLEALPTQTGQVQ